MDSRMTKSNFGGKGWLMIILAGVTYYFFAGTVNDGLNIIVGNYAGLHELDYNTVLSLATPAAWFGMLGAVVWAVVVNKIGSRLGGAIALLLGGISYAMYGAVSTAAGFFIITALVNFMAYGYCNTAAQVMIAHWFPIKKGLALGWATMGQNLSSAIFIPILLFLIARSGINGSFFGVGIFMAVFAVIYYVLARSTPEETGCQPDNGVFPEEELQREEQERSDYKSPWTVKKLLSNKQVWLASLGYGIYILVTVSLISQMIPRLMSGGWAQPKATAMMTVAAVLGLAGSYITGWLDQKIGTKKASVVYGIWYLVAVILCALPASDAVMYLSVFFTGIGIGGIGNLFPSMIATLFNRHDFVRALGVMNVISLLIRSVTFSIIAFGLSHFGGYAGAYAIVAVLNVIGIILIAMIKDERIRA